MKFLTKIRIGGKYLIELFYWKVKLTFLKLIGKRRTALASFPRSGNTWLRILLEDVTGESTGTIYQGEDRHFFHREEEGMVIKTHKRDMHRYTDAIFLIREPIDALESYYFWKREKSQNQRNETWEEHLEKESKIWVEEVQAWENFKGRLLILRYEDLVANPQKELSKVLQFLDRDKIPEEKIGEAIEKNTLDKLQKKYPKGGSGFFRKGASKKGSREKISKEEEKDLREKLYPFLKKYDYLDRFRD